MKNHSIIVAGAAFLALASTYLSLPAAHAAPEPAYAYGAVDDAGFAKCLNTKYLGQSATAQIPALSLNVLTITTRTIDCSNFGIVSLIGAQNLTGATTLTLSSNQISDLSPLASLTALVTLTLDHNKISTGITSLSGLTNLTSLTLSYNAIISVVPLVNLTHLTYLNLSNNKLTLVAQLSALTSLQQLSLDYNSITDVSALSGIINKATSLPGYIFLCRYQSGTAPSVGAGTYAIPVVHGTPTIPWSLTQGVVLNTSSPAKSATVNMAAWTITYPAPGTYMVDWMLANSTTSIFSGTYTIVVTDAPGTMYRIMNPSTGEHFYTSSAKEVQVNVSSGAWKYEGIGWVAPLSGTAVFRLAAIPGSGSAGHLFTTSVQEKDAALASKNPAGQPYWKCETGAGMPSCVGWYSGGSIPVFRAFYPGTGQHNYTTDTNEQRVITTQQGWTDEGIGWYGVAKGNPGAPMPAA